MKEDIVVKKFEDYDDAVRSIEYQWEYFFEKGEIPQSTRTVVANSWNRCLSNDVNPLRKVADVLPQEVYDQKLAENEFLIKVASPYLDELHEYFHDMAVVMLSNADGANLKGKATPRAWSMVENIRFLPGTDWSEAGAGTNAIGTAIMENQPIQVFANEHFCQGWHHFVCSASPIRDPFTNQVLGVLDLTGKRDSVHAHNLYLVMNQARKIEKEIGKYSQKQNMDFFNELLEFVNFPVVVFDKKYQIRKMNQIASSLFKIGDNLTNIVDKQFIRFFAIENKPQIIGCNYKGRKWSVKFFPYRVDNVHLGGMAVFNEEPLPRIGLRKPTRYTFDSIRTSHPKMIMLIEKAKKAAKMDLDLLITGETGVGKELFAQAIHAESLRSAGPFVAVNCGALPKELIASELFGYEPGAFTSSHPRGRKGKFAFANQGTIFLDEIGELPLETQAILLRGLEERVVTPLGGNKEIFLDFRVIAATNKDLKKEVEKGRFREDLYYRLNVLNIEIPPLRDRKEDIPILVNHFLAQRKNISPVKVSPQALDALKQYHWPGNIRELKNVIDKALLNDFDGLISIDDLPEICKDSTHESKIKITKDMLQTALCKCNYNIAQTARLLQVSRTTVYKKMREYGFQC